MRLSLSEFTDGQHFGAQMMKRITPKRCVFVSTQFGGPNNGSGHLDVGKNTVKIIIIKAELGLLPTCSHLSGKMQSFLHGEFSQSRVRDGTGH